MSPLQSNNIYDLNISIVIRSAGERTRDICSELIAQQAPNASITVIEEFPFELALHKCYETGINEKNKWLVIIDADVLPRSDAIFNLVRCAEEMPEHYFQLSGRIFDKITGLYRQAGNRIYRTALLPLAIEKIPLPTAKIRPEYYTICEMGQLGHPSRSIPELIGLHDFEQNYIDLYRKSVVHAKKHSKLLQIILERCANGLHTDKDYIIILKGVWDGLVTSAVVSIDKRKFVDEGKQTLEELGLHEKMGISDIRLFCKNFPEYIRGIVKDDPIPYITMNDEPVMNPSKMVSLSLLTKIKSRFDSNGPILGCVALVGAALKYFGQRLDR